MLALLCYLILVKQTCVRTAKGNDKMKASSPNLTLAEHASLLVLRAVADRSLKPCPAKRPLREDRHPCRRLRPQLPSQTRA